MKKQLLMLSSILFLACISFAQNKVNLVVFSEDGDAFYTYVNGVRQNDKPETNIKVTGLSPAISLRIVFDDKTLPEIKQNMQLESGFEHTARIKKDLKKQVKLRYFGQTPLEESAPGVPTVAYHSVENPSQTETATSQGNYQSHTTVTSSTTTTKGGAGSDNVSVNINMAGVGINMNVNGMDNNGATMHSSSSTTVTSSHSSTGYHSGEENSGSTAVVAGNNVKGNNCAAPMNANSFGNMKKSVESKPFSDTKMSTAKVATKNACLSVAQVKEICKLFTMDDEKLAYAKYAYDYCVDKANYYQVGDIFSFSSTTDEFNKFLEQ